MTLGPASVFLFVSGDNNIHFAELKGSEIIQEAPDIVLGTWECPVSGSHSCHLKLLKKRYRGSQ